MVHEALRLLHISCLRCAWCCTEATRARLAQVQTVNGCRTLAELLGCRLIFAGSHVLQEALLQHGCNAGCLDTYCLPLQEPASCPAFRINFASTVCTGLSCHAGPRLAALGELTPGDSRPGHLVSQDSREALLGRLQICMHQAGVLSSVDSWKLLN